MNWNGGTLPRASKNAKTSLSLVQRRHFAKARGKLQSGPTSSPGIDFSIFQDAKHANKRPHIVEPGAGRLHQDHQSQRVHESSGVAPTERHLSFIEPDYRNDIRNHSPLVEGDSRNEERKLTKPPFVLHSCPRPSSASTLESATSHVRQRDVEAPGLPAADDLEARRQELLRTRDWVGLDYTKPVHMKFAEVKDRDMIGKRRPVKKGNDERGHGVGNKRLKTAHGHERLSTPRHVPHRSASPEDISIRIGSVQSRSKRAKPRHSYIPSQDNSSVMSEEMLFAQEVSEAYRGYEQPRAHVYSQKYQSPRLVTHQEVTSQTSPARTRTSSVSYGRSVQRLAHTNNEEMADPPLQNQASAQGDQSTTRGGYSSLLSHRAPIDNGSEFRLIFDDLSQYDYENRDVKEPTTIDSEASLNLSTHNAVPRVTPASVKRYNNPVGHDTMDVEPVMQDAALDAFPRISAALLAPAERASPLTLHNEMEAMATKTEAYNDVLEAHQERFTVAAENLDSTAEQHKQQVGPDYETKSGNLSSESSQDEEKVWRDFVFGHGDISAAEAVDIVENPIPSTNWDHDESSMIAEFDFQETEFPKTDSLGSESSVVVGAFQRSSAGYHSSSDLPCFLAEASSSPIKVQQVTSNSSSDDPLAWTPGRFGKPKIVFKKPSKYLGDQGGTPVSILIGHNLTGTTLAGGGGSRPKELGKGKGRGSERTWALEDEIEDY